MEPTSISNPDLEKANDIAALNEFAKERQILKKYLKIHGDSLSYALDQLTRKIKTLEESTGVKVDK